MRFRLKKESEIFRNPDGRPTNDPALLALRKKEAQKATEPHAGTPLSRMNVEYFTLNEKDAYGLRVAERLLRQEAAESGAVSVHTVDELSTGLIDGFYKVALGRRNLGHVGVALAELQEGGEVVTHWYVDPSLRNRGIGKALLDELGVALPQGAAPTEFPISQSEAVAEDAQQNTATEAVA